MPKTTHFLLPFTISDENHNNPTACSAWCHSEAADCRAARRSCFRGKALFQQHLAVGAEARSTWIALGLFFRAGAVSSVWHVGMFSLAPRLGLEEECRVGKDSMWEPVWGAGSSVKFPSHLLWRHVVVSQVLLVHHSRPTDCQRVAAEPATAFRVSEKHCHFPHRSVSHTPLRTLPWVGGQLGCLAGAYQKFPKGTDYWGEIALMGEPGIICQNKQLVLLSVSCCLLGLFGESWAVAWVLPALCSDTSQIWKTISTCSVTFFLRTTSEMGAR